MLYYSSGCHFIRSGWFKCLFHCSHESMCNCYWLSNSCDFRFLFPYKYFLLEREEGKKEERKRYKYKKRKRAYLKKVFGIYKVHLIQICLNVFKPLHKLCFITMQLMINNDDTNKMVTLHHTSSFQHAWIHYPSACWEAWEESVGWQSDSSGLTCCSQSVSK